MQSMAGIEYLLSLSYSSLAPYIHCWGVFGHNFAKEGQQNKTRFAHSFFLLLLLVVVAFSHHRLFHLLLECQPAIRPGI
jgi:hypothetical protein